MKAFHKICVVFSCVITGLLVTSFYHSEHHNAVVLPVKMNVFYVGVDNLINISACTMNPDDVIPTLSNGSISKWGAPGSYIVRVNGGVQTVITLTGKDSVTNIGSQNFRIKRVPDPVAYLGNLKADGSMTKADLLAQSGIFARMENFDFDLAFTIVSFEMSLLVNGKWKASKAHGPSVTPEMKNDFAHVLPGDKVLFHAVTVKGPDGTMRKIPGVMINVK